MSVAEGSRHQFLKSGFLLCLCILGLRCKRSSPDLSINGHQQGGALRRESPHPVHPGGGSGLSPPVSH